MRGATAAVFLMVVAGIFQVASPASFPKNWKRCKQNDPDINKCLSIAVIDAVKKMENTGIPSLGVFPIDPLDVNEMSIIQGNNGPVTLNLSFKDLQILGIAKSTLADYKANLKEYKIYSKSVTPAFRLLGNYEANGRILLLPIQGKGKCDITLFELETEHFLTGETIKSNGKEYMKLTDYRITLKPKRMTVQFENLFNGDKALGETMNRFINDNWEAIFTEMRSTFEETFGAMFMEMANRIFTKLPFDDIFLP